MTPIEVVTNIRTAREIEQERLARKAAARNAAKAEAEVGVRAALEAARRIVSDRAAGGRMLTSKEEATEVFRQITAALANLPAKTAVSIAHANRNPEIVAAVQEALMRHPFWKPGLGSSGLAFGLANAAIDAYLLALSPTEGGSFVVNFTDDPPTDRAAVVEECARVAENYGEAGEGSRNSKRRLGIAKAIRALVPPLTGEG